MSVNICLNDVRDAAKCAGKAAKRYEDYANELNRKVSTKLTSLPGSDEAGYISTATTTVADKVKNLRNKKTTFTDIQTKLENMAGDIENYELGLKNGIANLGEVALDLDKRTPMQAFGDWLYGTFCVDFTNATAAGRWIGNVLKKAGDWVGNKFDKLVDWFKHGNGRYVMNIALSVIGAVCAVIGTIGAIALCVATGGAALPLLIAAVASTIATVLTLSDSVMSIISNVKALKISKKEHDPGKARYYGNIDGVSSYITKTDLGDEGQNAFWKDVGGVHDTTRVVASLTALICGSYGKAGLNYDFVRDSQGHIVKANYYYDKVQARHNFGNMFRENLGFRNRGGKWSFSFKNLFSKSDAIHGVNSKASLLEKQMITHKVEHWKQMKTTKKTLGFIKNTYKVVTGEGGTKAHTIIKMVSDPYAISSPRSFADDTIGEIVKWFKDTAEYVAS